MTQPHASVLLTGGAGFIGSHVAERLLELGFQVTIVDDLNDSYSPAVKRQNLKAVRAAGPCSFIEADICDPVAMRSAFEESRPDFLLHLAARTGVRASVDSPWPYFQTNVGGTLNLLDCARNHGVRKIVFASSSSIYGLASPRPFSEDRVILSPASPYAATKISGEALIQSFAACHGIKAVILRLFTVYGPRQRPDLAMHSFAERISRGEPLSLFGTGTTSRDYTWVGDIVDGMLAALRYDPPEGVDIFNLGNSVPVELNRMVSLLEQAMGMEAGRVYHEIPPGDVHHTCADLTRARTLLGYEPKVGIEAGIRMFAEWFGTTRMPAEAAL